MTKPGPNVVINGVTHETVIDARGTQRFRKNRIISDLLDNSTCAGPESKPFPGLPRARPLGLNEIVVDVHRGVYTQDERRELLRLIGYSIAGYVEIFPDDTVANPLWDAQAPTS